MVVDTSVILAIVLDEAEGETFIERILKSDAAVISAGSVVELVARDHDVAQGGSTAHDALGGDVGTLNVGVELGYDLLDAFDLDSELTHRDLLRVRQSESSSR